VVAEDDPLGRGDEVLAVLLGMGGRGALLVEDEDLGEEPLAVKPIGDGEGAEPGDDEPEGVDRFPPVEGRKTDGGGAQGGDA
jgi:hypothetical protein